MKWLLCLVVLGILVPAPVFAQCGTITRNYSYGSYYSPVTYQKKVVDEIYFTRFVAVLPLLDLPSYGSYYHPSPPAPVVAAPAPTSALPTAGGDTKQILDLLKSMDARLKKLEGGSPEVLPPQVGTTSPPPGLPDVVKVAKQKCAMCHQQGNEKSGGDFILLDLSGGLVKLTDGQLADIQTHVYRNTMPKLTPKAKLAGITPLTDEEAASFIEEAKRQRVLNRKK